MDKKFILYVKEYGYYAPNLKYADMWNITRKESARKLSLGQAIKVKRWLTNGGYEVNIEGVEE